MKIQYILNVLNEKEIINSINHEDKDFIKEIYNFILKYNSYIDNLPKFAIKDLLKILSNQEIFIKKRYTASGKMYLLSITNYVIESIRKKISIENEDLYKNYNLDINHQKFSSFAFEKFLSRQVDIIAYRGDSRGPSIIFQQGFQSICNPNSPIFSQNCKDFIEDIFISGGASVALSSDYKVACYFPITEDIYTYIYICKVNRAYNTAAEHYKRFVLNAKNVSNEYLMGVRINELNTDSVDPNNVYAAFKIERSLIYQFGSINYYGQRLPVKRSFKIKSIIFNSEKGSLLENKEFTEVKKHLNKVFFDLVNKEFVFSIDEIMKK